MKIFFKTLSLILLPILAIFIISYVLVKNSINTSFSNYIKSDTQSKFEIIKHDFINGNLNKKKLYDTYYKVYKKTFLRITLIRPDGKVIFDSAIPFKRIDKLENHKYRPEVQEAFKKGSGFSKRFSKTKQMYMLYYAKALPNGNILRISYPLKYVNTLKNRLEGGLYAVFLSTFFMIVIISALIARKLSFPVQKLNYIVDAIKNGKNIHFPRFKDENLSKAAALIYKIYKAMEYKQQEIKLEKQKLDSILESIEEGVLLLTNGFSYVHSNAKFKDMFRMEPKKNENILSCIKDHELLASFSEILEKKNNRTFKIKERNYRVYCKTFDKYTLFVLNDIEDEIQYEYFKSELVGNISHELKTPVAALVGYAETLLINNDLNDKTKKEFTKKMYESSIRLNNLINDIIELHRLENFNADEIAEEVNLKELKKELNGLYKNTAKSIHMNFEKTKISITKEHLLSILTNLIDNAIKYSSGNNVYVTIKNEGSDTLIIVDDEGPAIDDKDKKRIFERFYTCSKSRNKQKSGTGLGLSIVKHISFLYGGFVELKSNSFGGNSFIVSIKNNKPAH